MSIATMILGQSGTGKTASLRNLDPASTLLIQPVKKPLPFKSTGWGAWSKENHTGNIFHTDQAGHIIKIMHGTKKPVIVIDDFQYILANEFMRRVLDKETGNAAFAKYNEIAHNAWSILMAASQLDDWKRVYILGHTQEDESGKTKAKTIGKLLDEKITLEGLLTIVLRTNVINGNYLFSTKNSGNDTVKSPIGLFDEELIENDLKAIDQTRHRFKRKVDVSLRSQSYPFKILF
jgi:hypothetical protein